MEKEIVQNRIRFSQIFHIQDAIEIIQQSLQLYWSKKGTICLLLLLFYIPTELLLRWFDSLIFDAAVLKSWSALVKDSLMFGLRLIFYLPIQVPLLVLAWMEWENVSPTIYDVFRQFRNRAMVLYVRSVLVGCVAFVLLEALQIPFIYGACLGGFMYVFGGRVVSVLLALCFLCLNGFVLVSTLFFPYFSATEGLGLIETFQFSFRTIKIRYRWAYLSILLLLVAIVENGITNLSQYLNGSLQLPFFILIFLIKLLIQPVSCFILTACFLNWTQSRENRSQFLSFHTSNHVEGTYASIMEMDQ